MHERPNDLQLMNPAQKGKVISQQQQSQSQQQHQFIAGSYNAMNWNTTNAEDEVADEAEEDDFEDDALLNN